MNEVTAAIGLAQVQRVTRYLEEEYTPNLRTMNEAIEDCEWLRPRHVPAEAKQCGYIWSCTWQGDRVGLDYDRFQATCRELELPIRFGFNQKPAYQFDIFKGSTAYHVPDCPVRCPFYTSKSDYRYRDGLCPVAEDLMPRLVTTKLIEFPPSEIQRQAERLREAIARTERTVSRRALRA
jgi:hypothetical protein